MSASQTEGGRMLNVQQVRSGIGFDRTQKATLKALGLGRIGRVRRHPDNPQIRGMIAKIPHLVVVVGGPDEDRGQRRGQP